MRCKLISCGMLQCETTQLCQYKLHAILRRDEAYHTRVLHILNRERKSRNRRPCKQVELTPNGVSALAPLAIQCSDKQHRNQYLITGILVML